MTAPQPRMIGAVTDPTGVETDEEVPARRQPGQLVELFIEGEDPYTVRIGNRDRIAWEKTAARHREWPTQDIAPHFSMTFVCWAAARREQRTDLSFEQWQTALEDWEIVTEAPADPTR